MSASDAYTVRPSEIRGMTDAGRKSLSAWIARVNESTRRVECRMPPLAGVEGVTRDIVPAVEPIDAVRRPLPRVIEVALQTDRNVLAFGDDALRAGRSDRERAYILAVRLTELQGWEVVTPAVPGKQEQTLIRWPGGEARIVSDPRAESTVAQYMRPAKAPKAARAPVARKARTVVAVAAPVTHRTVTREVHATPRTSAWLTLVARMAA